MVDENKNPWTVLNSEKIYENPWITVFHNDVLNPSNKEGIYGIIKYKYLALGVIPLDDEYNTWIVGQYRFPLEKYSWEIPEGGGPLDVDPLISIKRELEEECGIHAKEWVKIQDFHLSNSVTDEFGHLYIAKKLSFVNSHPDEDEQLQVKKVHFDELFEMAQNGTITDGMSLISIYKTKYLIDNNLI